MMRGLLVRGMLTGLVAAAFAFVFAMLIGEPQVDAAIAVEELRADAHHTGDEAAVSRTVQKTLGLATGLAMYGVAIGGLFALAFAVAYGRIGRLGAHANAVLLALGGFVAVALVPFLKYPASPPAVGDPATVERRTVLYLGLIVIAVLVAVGAFQLGRRLTARFGTWNATLLGGGAFVLAVTIAIATMPSVNEVAPDFPATTLWKFRLASLGVQVVVWATLGLLFGPLAARVLGEREAVSVPDRAYDAH